nr:MAG TPA: hypothetical protein [Caudoviricetes sp.]
MPCDVRWSTVRLAGLHKHHIFGGVPNRRYSEEDGLVIFLTPEDHNMSEKGIHANREFDLYAKRKAQLRWMEFYDKTEEEFRQRYGASWL